MRLFRSFGPVLLTGGLLVMIGVSSAVEKNDEKPPVPPELTEKEKQAHQDIEDLNTAFRLTEMGEKTSAPELLLSAASLLRKLALAQMDEVSVKPRIERDKGARPGDKLVDEEAKDFDCKREAARLIQRAREIAADPNRSTGNVNLEPLIKDIENRKLERGVKSGPRHVSRKLGGRQMHTFQVEVEELSQFSFSYKSITTVRVEIIRADTGHVHAQHTHTAGGGACNPGKAPGKKKTVTMTVRVINTIEKVTEYQVWMQ